MKNSTRKFAILTICTAILWPMGTIAGIEEHSPDPLPGFSMFDDIILFDPDKAAESAEDSGEWIRDDEREEAEITVLCPACVEVQPEFDTTLVKWKFAQWGIDYLADPEQVVLTGGDEWDNPEFADDTETQSATNPHHQKVRERRDEEDQKPSLKSALGRIEAELEPEADADEPQAGCSVRSTDPSSIWLALLLAAGVTIMTRRIRRGTACRAPMN